MPARPLLRALPTNTARSGIFKKNRRFLFAQLQHFFRQLPDLPLGTVAAPKGEEMTQLPGVHRDDE